MSAQPTGGDMRIDRNLPVGAQVRAVFEQSGGRLSTRQLANLCHSLQIDGFTDEDAEEAAMSHFTSRCRNYLKDKDDRGLPFAGQSASRKGEWQARRWWDVPTYRLNIGEYVQQRDESDRIAQALGVECRERHGVDPYSDATA